MNEKSYYVLELPRLTQEAAKSTAIDPSLETWLKYKPTWTSTLKEWRKYLFNRQLLTPAIDSELLAFEEDNGRMWGGLNTSKKPKSNSRFPHTCVCGSNAYFGSYNAECSGCSSPRQQQKQLKAAIAMTDYDLLTDV